MSLSCDVGFESGGGQSLQKQIAEYRQAESDNLKSNNKTGVFWG